jgi:hypothetical protein
MDLTSQLSELKRKVDFNTYDISVKELISMVNEGIIDIAPEYQRQFRWKSDRQSTLIESILLGIPVPSLYMATNADGTWELIDGVQRLSSIIHFAGTQQAKDKIGITGNLTLTELKKLTSFNSLLFETLPKSIQLDFLLKPLKITTLSDKSDLEVRFDLFERLNTGGIALTDQEIRSCVYRGPFNDYLKKMADDSNYRDVVKLNQGQEADGTREEFVLRFFAFYYNYLNFDHSVVDFLNSFMSNSNKSFDYERATKVFKKTFKALAELPNGIIRNRTTTPTNLFEGVAVGAALALSKKATINTTGAKRWMSSKELTTYTTGATNSRIKVVNRIEYCRDKFLSKNV